MAEAIALPVLGQTEQNLLWAVLASSFVALGYGVYLIRKVLSEKQGTPGMEEVSRAVQVGSSAYLKRQFQTIILLIAGLTAALYFLYQPVYQSEETRLIPFGIALAFLLGSLASFSAGVVGMYVATRANVKVAASALTSFKRSLETAFQAGTVSGMFTVGLGLLGATIIFLLFKEQAMRVLVGFGFGGALVALFMRIGGGIYTKAADIGADLVGKVEKNIPEDDPRNAATIADNVGDNVGDCAGMAADVFESYEVTLVAAIILGAATLADPQFIATYGPAAPLFALKLVIFPLLVRAVGVFASIIGTLSVKGSDRPGRSGGQIDPMRPINTGFWISALVATLGFGGVVVWYLKDPLTGLTDYRFFFATLTGIVLALVIGWLTNYFTSIDKQPVKELADSTKTGPATLILSGVATGMESSFWGVVAIALTILASFTIFSGSFSLAAYGISLAGLGLLTTTGYILAMDTFGPISDNANGIFEMSGALKKRGSEKAAAIVAKLDAVGNTTKALTKGFAIATAVIAAIALFRSFIDEAKLAEVGIQVNAPQIFIGLLIGGAVPFLFSSFAIRAVSRAAMLLVEEVRRQFREIPGLMEGKSKPDYARPVAISTAAAQKELVGPAVLAVATPVLVAFGLGAAALGGYLAGAILTGQLLAVFMANAGGAWDNAKKKIEEGYLGGKGTDVHKAAVVGDTVGDPFKDTAGPALNPLIKVMNLVGILIAPLAIQNIASGVRLVIVLVAAALLTFVIFFSRRQLRVHVSR